MIGDQIKGKDFYGLLAYHEKKAKEGKGYFLDSNIKHGLTVDMTKEFNVVRQLRPALSKAVYHVSLNLPYNNDLTDKEFTALGWDYLQGMGFDDNQYIMYRHIDQEHSHIHLVANRVKFSGDVVSDSKDYERSQILVRKLEKKYGLSQLTDAKVIKESVLTRKEIEKAFRTGEVPIKLLLQQKIKETISNSIDVAQFVKGLKELEIFPRFNASITTGRVTGISFKYQEITYKGSTLGKYYSWNNIIKHIDYEQSRDSRIVLENTLPKRGAERAYHENGGTTTFGSGTSGRTKGGSGEINEKSKHYLAKAKTDGLITDYSNNTDWTPFKLEMGDKKSKKKRKRKGRRL